MHDIDLTYAIIGVAVMAVVTYLIRMIPMMVFRQKIKSRFIRSFLGYVPYAVLTAMTFPAIFSSTGSTLSACIGTVAALALAYFGRSLITVALGAAAIVYIVSLFGV